MARSGKDEEQVTEYREGGVAPNPVWFKPIMLGLMILVQRRAQRWQA